MNEPLVFSDPTRPAFAPPEWVWLLVNLLIPVIGVVFLDWNLFILLYLFWMEIIMIGFFGCLGIILAYNGKKYYLASLVPKIGSLAAFIVLYGALTMLIIAFSLGATDLDAMFDDPNMANSATGFGWALVAMFIGFTLDFLSGYVLNLEFRRSFHMFHIVKNIIRIMPIGFIIIFALVPLSEKWEGHQANLVLVLGILVFKTLAEFFLEKGRSWVADQEAEAEIETANE